MHLEPSLKIWRDLWAWDKRATETDYVLSLIRYSGANKFKLSNQMQEDQDSVQYTHARTHARKQNILLLTVYEFIPNSF